MIFFLIFLCDLFESFLSKLITVADADNRASTISDPNPLPPIQKLFTF